MRGSLRGFFVLACFLSCGCTHAQLRYSSISQGSTLTDIQYKQVLNNLAMFTVNPDVMPYFATAGSGSAQIVDNGGLSALSFQWPVYAGSGTIFAQRSIAEQWGLAPVLEPDRLKAMRCAYRLLVRSLEEPCDDCSTELAKFLGRPVDLECRIPRGWFCVGRWWNMPHGVYYGHYRGTYVWVPEERLEGLTQFTMTILIIATAVPASPQTYTLEKYCYENGNLVRKEVHQLNEPEAPMKAAAVPTGVAPAAPPQMYVVPRVAPSIQFFPQPR